MALTRVSVLLTKKGLDSDNGGFNCTKCLDLPDATKSELQYNGEMEMGLCEYARKRNNKEEGHDQEISHPRQP